MYYTFTEDLLSNERAFEERMDDLCREIGTRGQQARLPEAVPPVLDPAPSSAPAPAPALTHALEQAVTAVPSTPEMQMQAAPETRSPSVQDQGSADGGVVGIAELITFLREERLEAKADRADMEAKLEARLDAKEAEMNARLDAKDAEMEAKIAALSAPEPQAITDEDLVALQARLEALHASKLITDEVRCGYRDIHAS